MEVADSANFEQSLGAVWSGASPYLCTCEVWEWRCEEWQYAPIQHYGTTRGPRACHSLGNLEIDTSREIGQLCSSSGERRLCLG